jgi:hypothetical protein
VIELPASETSLADESTRPLAGQAKRPNLAGEVALVLAFYLVYTWIRNQFGSASVSADRALQNARHIIDFEKSIGLYIEPDLHDAILGSRAFVQFWNLFYGSFHFAVTIGVLAWLFIKFPERYRQWRTVLLTTIGLSLTGFALFPVMPPRLLANCGEFGGCDPSAVFVDTSITYGGLWSFDSGTAVAVSNQFAAMPSLHFAWAMWCTLALWPVLRHTVTRSLMAIYPVATVYAVIVTANHYWLDVVGGAIVLGVGVFVGNWRIGKTSPVSPSTVVSDVA